jgi:hypothetical protein
MVMTGSGDLVLLAVDGWEGTAVSELSVVDVGVGAGLAVSGAAGFELVEPAAGFDGRGTTVVTVAVTTGEDTAGPAEHETSATSSKLHQAIHRAPCEACGIDTPPHQVFPRATIENSSRWSEGPW